MWYNIPRERIWIPPDARYSTTLVYNNYNSDGVLKDANSAVGAVESDLRLLAQERHQQQAANAANRASYNIGCIKSKGRSREDAERERRAGAERNRRQRMGPVHASAIDASMERGSVSVLAAIARAERATGRGRVRNVE